MTPGVKGPTTATVHNGRGRVTIRLLRRALRKVMRGIPFLDTPFRWASFRCFSWQIRRVRGIHQMQAVPLIAWVNYHQTEILGKQCYWLGHRALKHPFDAWIYQEIIYEVRPDIIIELGNKNGGSTLFLASICELLDHGRVLGIDLDHSNFGVHHRRIELLTGDCASDEVLSGVRERCVGQKVMVIHDADHSRDAVLRDLYNYAPLVSPGSYIIIEDSTEGIPGFWGSQKRGLAPFLFPNDDTPLQAIKTFTRDNPDFVIDRSRERYILTSNCMGYLRRLEDPTA